MTISGGSVTAMSGLGGAGISSGNESTNAGSVSMATTGTVISNGGAADSPDGAWLTTGTAGPNGRISLPGPAPLGSVSPQGTVSVAPGGSGPVTITPNAGYAITLVLNDGTDVTAAVSNGVYTLDNVADNHTIAVTFRSLPDPASITPTPVPTLGQWALVLLALLVGSAMPWGRGRLGKPSRHRSGD